MPKKGILADGHCFCISERVFFLASGRILSRRGCSSLSWAFGYRLAIGYRLVIGIRLVISYDRTLLVIDQLFLIIEHCWLSASYF